MLKRRRPADDDDAGAAALCQLVRAVCEAEGSAPPRCAHWRPEAEAGVRPLQQIAAETLLGDLPAVCGLSPSLQAVVAAHACPAALRRLDAAADDRLWPPLFARCFPRRADGAPPSDARRRLFLFVVQHCYGPLGRSLPLSAAAATALSQEIARPAGPHPRWAAWHCVTLRRPALEVTVPKAVCLMPVEGTEPWLGSVVHLALRRGSVPLAQLLRAAPRLRLLRLDGAQLTLPAPPVSDSLEVLELLECDVLVPVPVLAAGRLPRLRELVLEVDSPAEGLDALTSLRRLQLQGAAVTPDTRWPPRLDALWLKGCRGEARVPPGLSYLQLDGVRPADGFLGESLASLAFFSRAPGALPASLTHLDLAQSGLGSAGLPAGLLPPSLTSLGVSRNRLGDAGLAAVVRSLPSSVAILDVSANLVTSFACCCSVRLLQVIDISQNPGTASGFAVLCSTVATVVAVVEVEVAEGFDQY